jgi:hypothetical protein
MALVDMIKPPRNGKAQPLPKRLAAGEEAVDRTDSRDHEG